VVLLLALAATCGAQTGGRGESINVREAPYLARGDGKTDDTAAFQKALQAASLAGGGTVFAPAGRYYIAGHLRVPPNCTLMGVGRAPQTYDPKEPRTTLLAVEGAGNSEGTPFLSLAGPNATLEGVTVLYPDQKIAATPVAYPWTLRGSGDNVSVINVLLVNPYRGLDLGTVPAGRHYVRGLYGQPLQEGLMVDQCYDVGRIKEVHFWPFWTQDKRVVDYTTNHATGFTFRRTDWEVVEDVFVWGYQTGIRLAASPKGAMNGQMSNVNLDNVDIGLDVEATLPYAIHFANLNIANAGAGKRHIAIWGHGDQPAEITIRGASFWGLLNQALVWANPGTISLSDSRVVEWNSAQHPAMIVQRGRAILHDNSFVVRNRQTGVAVRIDEGAENAIVHHNLLNGHAVKSEGTRRIVEGNL
jgi:hypothetical protein